MIILDRSNLIPPWISNVIWFVYSAT
jgi:hypothetical protein